MTVKSALLSLVVLGGVAAGLRAAPAPAKKVDEDNVLGTFVVVVLERNGVKASDAELKTMKVVQTKEKWVLSYANGLVVEGTEKFDRTKKPKQVDNTYLTGVFKGRTTLGVYEVRGDTVKYCWGALGKPRPTDFTAGPGSGRTLLVLKRVKK
jgi:uncharacterized protein (TIGR03067 family)